MKFKVGDWVIHGFEICQVTAARNGVPTEVANGGSRTSSGSGLACYPLTIANKNIADSVAWWHKRFHGQPYHINYPDLYRRLVNYSERAMSVSDDPKAVEAILKQLDEFCKKLWNYLRDQDTVTIDGFQVWGQGIRR